MTWMLSKMFQILDLRFYFQPDDDCTHACRLLYTSIKNWQNTLVVPEIRSDDPIFKRLITQVWEEYQYQLNKKGKLFGYMMEPFEVDSKLPNPINDSFSGPGYQANVQMQDIKVYLILYLLFRNSTTHLTTRCKKLDIILENKKMSISKNELLNLYYSLKKN